MRTLFFSLLMLLSLHLMAQGCSDAGFCTMGAMRPDQHKSQHLSMKINALEFTQHLSNTKFGDYILSYILDVELHLHTKTRLHFKLPYTFVFNQMPSVNGIGDISLSVTHLFLEKNDWQIAGTFGGKIPTNGNNLSHEGRPLPSYYQTSLGTYDIVLGGAINYKSWLFAVGYQQPLNRTKNEFLKPAFEGSEYAEEAQNYANSRQLLRSPDIMMRLEKNFRIGRFSTHIGLLPIYRLKNDEFMNAQNISTVITESNGLTLNALLGVDYRFSTKSAFKVLFGQKLITRERNPDGLGRENVLNMGYEIRF